jgi:hypothetical protein
MKELLGKLVEEYNKSVTVDGVTKSVVHQPSFAYHYNDKDEKEDNHLVNIDVGKFDDLFHKSDYYVGKGGTGQIKNRYNEFGDWYKTSSEDLHAPYVSFSNDEPHFTNGRHRYAWLRDNGVHTIPMSMSSADRDTASKLNLIRTK